jgi:ABC-type multidrug transport system ATPase subunit
MSLRIKDVNKVYPNKVQALKSINLDIEPGVFGLLGPNGAGKSSLMRTIAALQLPDTGSIWLDNIDVLQDPIKLKSVLGYLPQEFGFYPEMSVEQILHHFAILKGYPNTKERNALIYEMLEKTNLLDKAKNKTSTLSGGMKQRLGIAIALLGKPQLIIVDEPTAGLDPIERTRFLNLLSSVNPEAVVILSTHIVSDVSELCSKMAILNKGQILVYCNPAEAVQNLEGKIWKKVITANQKAEIGEKYEVLGSKMFAGQEFIQIKTESKPDETWQLVEPNLEHVYLSYVK